MRVPDLDRLDRMLLNLIQDDFPVDPRPYRVLADRLEAAGGGRLDEGRVLARVDSLRGRGHLRRLGAIVNSGPLGYRSTLCAAKVPPDILDRTAAMINARPEVTHNYVREGDLNVWFTFCHRDRSALEAFLAELAALPGLGPVLELPARRVYKIRAVFNLPTSP
jgi:DNA-binding Lrp family transcriptional regulator